jgi:hypothetical protein
MHQDQEISKLTALRSKTDRQLMMFIQNRLDWAIASARLDDRDGRHQARQIHEQICELLPVVDGLTGQQRRMLEGKLARLAELVGSVRSPRAMSMCG